MTLTLEVKQTITGFIRLLENLEKDPFHEKNPLENLEKHLDKVFFLEMYYEFLTTQRFCFQY